MSRPFLPLHLSRARAAWRRASWRFALGVFATVLGLATSGFARAADTPHNFDDPARQAQYLRLIAELRCLVCQNQSLADSHADLAQDLRDEVYRMVQDGQKDEQIVGFLVDRYGDFVLYKPPLNVLTFMLWFGPGLLVVLAGIAWWRLARRRAPAAPPELAPADRTALDAMLQERDQDRR